MIIIKDIKNFLVRIKNLIVDSKAEWKKIEKEDKSKKQLLRDFLIPMASFCGIISFTSSIFEYQLYTSITILVITIATIFAGTYSCILILKEVRTKSDITEGGCEKMIIYSASVFFIFHSLTNVFDEGSILRALLQLSQFLCVIPVWGGLGTIIKTKASNKAGFAVLIVLLITIIPSIFEKLLSIILDVPLATI
jgi:hypothetical protein